jgi:hypothetical protein
MDVSYFSGKVEMNMRYKELKFDRLEPTLAELHNNIGPITGYVQVPIVRDKRKHIEESRRWLIDSTFILRHLENDRMISNESLLVLPKCPVQRFFQYLLEDFADEYCWRPAMHYRWAGAHDRLVMGDRFTFEFARECPQLIDMLSPLS